MRAKITLKQLEEDIKLGMTTREIAEKYSCLRCTVARHCHRAGIALPAEPPHHRARKHTFNTRFFETIDSESKAYSLGFIAADGGRDRNAGVKIVLNPRDTDILIKIANAMECSNPPYLAEHGTRIRLSFYNVDMIPDLEKYGIVERKTSTLPFAQNVPDEYLRHYLRGMFDGDGSLGRQARLVTGSEPFYRGFMAWYAQKYGKLPWTKDEGNKYRMVFNQKKDGEFIRWMYDNATIVLDRKNQLFLRNWNKS